MSGATGTVLERILAETRAGASRAAGASSRSPSRASARAPGRFRDALAAPGIGVIAEFKRRSPSAGALHDAPELEAIVAAYERGGAVAASILTEEPNFGGSLEDLRAARRDLRRCRCCARTSSSTATSCSRRAPPAPTRCC